MSKALIFLVVSRWGSCVPTMVYAGSLPFLLNPWSMSATEAGLVQSAFNLCFGASLLVSSWAADRIGPRLIFDAANWVAVIAFLACALFARDSGTAVVLFGALGLALGASYSPALMLVSNAVPPKSRGAAIGWLLAGQSVGYFTAIALSAGLVPSIGFERGWLYLAAFPAIAAIAGNITGRMLPMARAKGAVSGEDPAVPTRDARRAGLLTAGYSAHCWELFGMWAWAPAFLTIALAGRLQASSIVMAVLIAGVLHLAGALATLVCGAASDRVGRKRVLVGTAIMGAGLSSIFGWTADWMPIALLTVAALYGFAPIADSGVLSTAMTEAVPPHRLGRALALRSALGFAAGAAAPLAVGQVLDWSNPGGGPATDWTLAFGVLGIGGLVAAICATLLPTDIDQFRKRGTTND